MSEVALVPAWRRPEFLHACLRRIEASWNDEVSVRIHLDRGYSALVKRVADEFRLRHPKRVSVWTINHKHRGNSYNVLYAYGQAVAGGFDLVHLIEEDVLIADDYFQMHRDAHELYPYAFSASACRNQQFPIGHEPPQEEDAVYEHPAFQSLGVSFRRATLVRALGMLADEYFDDMIGYCRSAFPASSIPVGNAEQDGFLHRVSEDGGLLTAYPAVPRAYHAGFVGYHRKGEPLRGTLEECSDALLSMDAAEMNRRAGSYSDHATTPLTSPRNRLSRRIQWP